MNNFVFQSGTKIIFGRGVVGQIGDEAAELGKKALLIYGRESIKKSGLYKLICDKLEAAGISITEHSGVSANPVLTHTEEGVKKAKDFGADMIIAAGGGSVIDEGKVIAAGARFSGDLWDLISGKSPVEDALPVIAVQTLPATSSETNEVGVITNEATNEKFGLRSPRMVPAKAFLDPELTFTIPLKYTAYACFDIMSHMLEGYLTTTAEFAPVNDGFAEGLCTAVKAGLERILKNPEDYDARAAVMWAGALAWNGLTNAGLEGALIPNHMLAHPLGAVYNAPHGAALASIFPAWMSYRKEENRARILRFGEKILGMKDLDTAAPDAADRVIEEFSKWIKSIGCPLTMKEMGIENPDIDELVKQARTLCGMWGIPGYTDKDLEAIYRSFV